MLNSIHQRLPVIVGPLGIAFLGLCVLVACVEDPRPAPSADRRPALNSPLRSPTTPLVRSELKTQADYDELETTLLRRMGVRELIAVYTKMAEGREVTTDPTAVLLLQRLAMLHLRLGTREGGFQEAFSIADRLRQQAPKEPHTEFLIGAITALLLPNAADGSYDVPARRMDVAQRLVEHWERLLKVAPDYVGPGGRGAAQVRKDLSALKAALAAVALEAKAVAPEAKAVAPEAKGDVPQAGDVGTPEGSSAPQDVDAAKVEEGTDTVEPSVAAAKAPVAPPAVSTASDPDVATAQQDLHRLDTGDTMARRVLCRDRTERRLDLKKTAHDVVRWVELRCAIDLDDGARALQWLTALVSSGAAQDPCRWVGRIDSGDEASRAALNAAISERGLAPCPPR